jgi:hypothetical protein
MDSHNHKPESFGGIVLKVLLIVIIGGAIFGVGVCAGIRAAMWRGIAGTGISSRAMMNNKTLVAPPMMERSTKEDESWGWGKDDQKMTRVFGAITKIEGNQITILNNAVKNEIVLSLSSTVITSSSSEIGIGALKAGQNIAALGALNANNMLEARLIEVR